jgi:PAS domain S-box-containing protein/putative nucleotidyltransferase with HDIG domain
MKDKSLRALIVDDSEDDVLLIIRELKKGGYDPVYERVETAETMEKSLKDKPWDIILCDYKMPNFSAPSAIALLKETSIDIPIIIISGAIGEETAVECIRLGARDYIMKGNFTRLCPVIARELKDAEVRNKKKHIEENLRYEEQLCRAFIEHSLDIIVHINPEGIITYINPAVERVLGFKPEERIGADAFELVHPDDMKFSADSFNTLVKDTNSPVIQGEMHLRHKDGSWRTMEVIGSNLVNGNVIEAIIVNYRDITERKLLERSLVDNEARLRTLVQTIPDLIWLKDADGIYLACNTMFERFFSAREADIVGKTDYDFVDRELADFFREHDRKAIAAGKPSANEEWLTFADDGYRGLFETIKTPMYDIDGRLIGVLGIAHDITERKKTEEALKKSEEKYRNIFENAIEGIYQSTIEGRFITVNAALARMAGYESPEKLIESIKDMGTQLYVHPEDRKRFLEILEIREAKGFVEGFEVEFYKKNKSKFWVVINARTVKDEQGKILYTEGLIEDITIRKHAGEQLLQTLDKLKKAVGTTIQVLISALEARDPYTASHQKRVADLARTIATVMGFSQDKIEGIRMAGSIHDIGKLSIPAEILVKPTKLTNLEYSLIKEHVKAGYEMLKDVESPWPLAEIVHQHHERMNGSGYPRNLKGDEIIPEARIMAVADVVEAMASHRPYRAALGIQTALEEIEKNKGLLYDDAVVDACLKLFREKGYQLLTLKS